MRKIIIHYKDNTTETFEQNKPSYFTVDEKTRIVYIVYPHVVIRIPFESIRKIEEETVNE